MNKKYIAIILGTTLSFALLIYVFYDLDWQQFWTSLKNIHLLGILIASLIFATNILLRSLRWQLIAGIPVTNFKPFWQATNIGYLGNIIYPARAGEVLRIIAIHHFIALPLSRAVTSSVIDRMLDVMFLGGFTLILLWIHGHQLNPSFGQGVIYIALCSVIVLSIIVIYARRWHQWLEQKQLPRWKLLHEWILHGLESVDTFRHTRHLPTTFIITLTVFLLDYYAMWQILLAFGWELPFSAGLAVGVFTVLGASLPSAPGFVGIYQVACIFALGLYNIEQSQAVAYSIILQLTLFLVVGIQGTIAAITCGFNFSKESQKTLVDETE